MTKDEIKAKVHEVFEREFGADLLAKFVDAPEPFKSLAEAKGDFGATQILDSLDHVEFIMAIEEEFGIEIDDVSAQLVRSLEDCVNTVDTRLSRPLHGAQ